MKSPVQPALCVLILLDLVSRAVSLASGSFDSASSNEQDRRPVLPEGTRVRIEGLRNAVGLNGAEATVQGFDQRLGRYVVKLEDGVAGQRARALKRVRPDNLEVLDLAQRKTESLADAVSDLGSREEALVRPGQGPLGERPIVHSSRLLGPGARVTITGLRHSSALNGLVGTIMKVDVASGRFVVNLAGMPPRKILPVNLALLADSSSGTLTQTHQDQSQQQERQPESDNDDDGRGAQEDQQLLKERQQQQQLEERQQQQQGEEQQRGAAAASICKRPFAEAKLAPTEAAASALLAGPADIQPGSRVQLHGLTSQVAQEGGWNGLTVIVHCFDTESGRYVVEFPGGLSPRKITAEHLTVLEASIPSVLTAPAKEVVSVTQAAKVKSAAAAAGVPESYTPPQPAAPRDPTSPGLVAQEDAMHVFELQPPKVSICNAYQQADPIQVYAMPAGQGSARLHKHLVRDLPYQACVDVPLGTEGSPRRSLPKALVFVVGRFQVARVPLLSSSFQGSQALELTLYRNNVNSLKGFVRRNVVQTASAQAYYLHVVNAYAGTKKLQLQAARGTFAQTLPLNRAYRLTLVGEIQLTLMDGSRRVRLSFQPRKSQTYCIIVTGAEEGLRGEPRGAGLVAHELGAWTVAEELPFSPGELSPPMAAAQRQPAAAFLRSGSAVLAGERAAAASPRASMFGGAGAQGLGSLFGFLR